MNTISEMEQNWVVTFNPVVSYLGPRARTAMQNQPEKPRLLKP